MALPSSPPITMQQIYAEFLVPHGTSFKQLYRGGPYVPNTAQNAAISTDPNSLRMTQFYGAVRYVPVFATKSGDANGDVFLLEPAPAEVNVNSNSVTITPSLGTGSYTCQWFHVSGSGALATPPNNVFTTSWGASVAKGTVVSGVKLCRVMDGVGFYDVNVSIALTYNTDL